MQKKILYLLYGMILLTFVWGCQKDLDLEFPKVEQDLVIEGSIEQGHFPKVVLTKSNPYFTKIDSASIANLIVTVAKVTVSDGINEEVLTLKRDDKYFPPFYYEGSDMKGQAGKTYDLTVELSGKKYTATTTIPEPVKLTGFQFFHNDVNDSIASIQIEFNDPPVNHNYYRVFTKRDGLDEEYLPSFFALFKDVNFNGQNFKFQLLKGTENISNKGNDLDYRKGDKISIKFCAMDKAHYDFWETAGSQKYTAANPLAVSNSKLISNIKGGLGVWGGYASTYYTIVVK